MVPAATSRLRFREMTEADLDDMSAMLGDPQVMRFYPRPRTRDEARDWISWTRGSYAEHGYGLWVIETHDDMAVETEAEVRGRPVVVYGRDMSATA